MARLKSAHRFSSSECGTFVLVKETQVLWDKNPKCADAILKAADRQKFYAEQATGTGVFKRENIARVRKDFNAPKAKFVCAIRGQPAVERPAGSEVAIFKARVAISAHPNSPQNSKPRWPQSTDTLSTEAGLIPNVNININKNYIIIGLAMGDAMLKLIKRSRKA